VLDHTRTDLHETIPDRGELHLGERVRLRDRGTHGVHQPERGGVEHEADLVVRTG
jgi:hypothetical protein